MPFRWFTMECFVQASALPHGVLGVLVDRTWAVHVLGVVGFIGALSVGVDDVDVVVRPTAVALSTSRSLQAVLAPMLGVILAACMIIVAIVMIIVAAVTIVIASLLATIVVAA